MAVVSRTLPQAQSRTIGGKQVWRVVRAVVLILGLGFFTIWTVFPLLWIVTTSFKTNKELYQLATILPHTFTWQHYD